MSTRNQVKPTPHWHKNLDYWPKMISQPSSKRLLRRYLRDTTIMSKIPIPDALRLIDYGQMYHRHYKNRTLTLNLTYIDSAQGTHTYGLTGREMGNL